MKTYLYLFIASFFSFFVQTEKEPTFSCDLNNVAFIDFVKMIEEQTDVRIFYQTEQVKNIKVTMQCDSTFISQALNSALKGTDLRSSKWHNHYVILKGSRLTEELPDFYEKQNLNEQDFKSELTKTEERYLAGRKSDVIKTLYVGKKSAKSYKPVKVSGKITDIDSGEPVIGGTIYIEETQTGAASDVNGLFTIVLKPGNYNATLSSLGYKSTKYFLRVYSDGRLKVELESATFSIQEAVIRGDRQMDIKSKDPGLEKLTVKSIKTIPMMMGERDILKVSEMLPGVVSVGEGSSGLNVRGGSSDQNAFYINKIPIYNTSHLFGFYPAFNSDIIKDFEIYKGHIPAEYGGRLSSVFNITTRQGNRKNFTAHGGINPIAANVTMEGPLKKEKSSVLISARSSYSNWILRQIKDPMIRNSSANFYDFAINFNYDFDKTLVSAFAYYSKDKFALSDINEYGYSNSGASINLHHTFNNSIRLNSSLVGAQYSFNTSDKQLVSLAYKYKYNINHYEFRNDLIHVLSSVNTLEYGFSTILYQLNKGPLEPFGNESLRQTINHKDESGFEAALYISDRYEITPWFDVSAGLRYMFYTALAKNDIFEYQDNQPRELIYIIDTLSFSNNEAVKWYTNPEFRVSMNFKTDNNGTVKLAFNQTSQNIFMLNNTISIAPNTQWKLADYHLKPSKSNQYSLGIFRVFPKLQLESSVEVFYKESDNISEFKDGANFLDNPVIETDILQGKQKSYGLEVLLKKTSGKINGWLAYTYSRSFVHIDGENSWDKINFGEKYPSNYDIPHVFNSVINYTISKRVTLSSVFTYQKGRPATYPVSIYYIDDIQMIEYDKRNKYRIPDYFRTDLSLSIEGNLKKDKRIHSSWMFSVYNITGRNNAYSVYFTSEEGKIKSYKYSVIGTPFFTITWLFKLGNYAAQ